MSSGVSTASADLRTEFGEIDIYLFDQLLRGRFDTRQRVLDAGCGAGRNLPYFLRHGFDVRAVDTDAAAIRSVRQLVASLNPALPPRPDSLRAARCASVGGRLDGRGHLQCRSALRAG